MLPNHCGDEDVLGDTQQIFLLPDLGRDEFSSLGYWHE
jgi:hypothetical protein